MDYTRLSLAQTAAGLEEIAADATRTFSGLGAQQLNWRPDATQWSVAQCFDHLLTANRLMVAAASAALQPSAPRTVWQRLPIVPGLLGPMLIRSQAPETTRKFTTSPQAEPAASAIAPDVIDRFVRQSQDAVATVRALDEATAARAIMTSPFIRVITYSVLDGWRLMLAHDRRHLEQARRVMQVPGFPATSTIA